MVKSIQEKGMCLVRTVVALALAIALIPCTTQSAQAAGDNLTTATSYTLGETINGSITDSNTQDIYRFSLSSAGRVRLTAKAYMQWIRYRFYDASGEKIWESDQYWDSTVGLISTNETVDLTAGTYYFAASQLLGDTGSYSFKLAFSSVGESFAEPQGGSNNTLDAAQAVSLGTSYTGQIATNDDTDIYRFTLTSTERVTLKANAYMSVICYIIYDSSGNKLWNSYQDWDITAGFSSTIKTINLTKGTYYFAVLHSFYTGKYTFRLSNTLTSLSLSKTSYTYNGKSHKPSVTVKSASGTVKSSNYKVTIVNAKGTTVSSPKAIGKYKVKVAGKGSYSGVSLSATFKINPPGTSISKVQGKSDKFSVKWKKKSAKTTTGYQIRYSSYKSMRYATTKTVKGAKKWQKTISYPTWSGTKLWLQVRTYKTVNGTKFYSKWSTKKSVRVKP